MRRMMRWLENLNERVSFELFRAFLAVTSSRGLMMAVLLGFVVVLAFAGDALAWKRPQAGTFLYDAYNIAVNKILKGAPGFLLGMGLMAYGGHWLLEGAKGRGIIALIIGGCLVKLDKVTASMGFYV